MQSFAVTVKGKIVIMRATTSRIPHHLGSGLLSRRVICRYQQADGFQLLVDSGSSKQFIGSELIRGVESRMLEYTKIEPPM